MKNRICFFIVLLMSFTSLFAHPEIMDEPPLEVIEDDQV